MKTEKAVYLAVVLVLIIPKALWEGYVLSILWAWFAVPTFGAPPVGTVQAAGLSVLVGLLTFHWSYDGPESGNTAERRWGRLFGSALVPALALALGWAFKSMM